MLFLAFHFQNKSLEMLHMMHMQDFDMIMRLAMQRELDVKTVEALRLEVERLKKNMAIAMRHADAE